VKSLKTRVLVFAIIAGLAAVAQADIVTALFWHSLTNISASHIVLIPIVSLGLVWLRRGEIFASVSTAKLAGSVTIGAGAAVAVAARLFSVLSGHPDQLTLLVGTILICWIGGFLFAFGWQALVAARFALLFLAFTMPFPPALLEGAIAILQRGSTEAVAMLFTLTGTVFHRDGSIFAHPGLTIEVADVCSGIRSSIALFLTALLAGHMFLRNPWHKALLLAVVLPITIFKNGVRIASLSLLTAYVDPGVLAGRLHHEGGIVFFLLALVLFVPVLAVLRRSEAIRSDGVDASYLTKPHLSR
jgi:exosortase